MRGENLVPLFPETTESWLLLYLCGMWTLFIWNPFWPKTAKCVFFRIYSTTFLVSNLNMLYLLSWLHVMLELVMCMLVAQLCLTLCDPMDCSSAGSSVPGILQAGILEWVTIPFSRGSSWLRDGSWVSCIAGRFLTVWATRETACICIRIYQTKYLEKCTPNH